MSARRSTIHAIWLDCAPSAIRSPSSRLHQCTTCDPSPRRDPRVRAQAMTRCSADDRVAHPSIPHRLSTLAEATSRGRAEDSDRDDELASESARPAAVGSPAVRDQDRRRRRTRTSETAETHRIGLVPDDRCRTVVATPTILAHGSETVVPSARCESVPIGSASRRNMSTSRWFTIAVSCPAYRRARESPSSHQRHGECLGSSSRWPRPPPPSAGRRRLTAGISASGCCGALTRGRTLASAHRLDTQGRPDAKRSRPHRRSRSAIRADVYDSAGSVTHSSGAAPDRTGTRSGAFVHVRTGEHHRQRAPAGPASTRTRPQEMRSSSDGRACYGCAVDPLSVSVSRTIDARDRWSAGGRPKTNTLTTHTATSTASTRPSIVKRHPVRQRLRRDNRGKSSGGQPMRQHDAEHSGERRAARSRRAVAAPAVRASPRSTRGWRFRGRGRQRASAADSRRWRRR